MFFAIFHGIIPQNPLRFNTFFKKRAKGLLPSLFSGAIITEQVFDLPGIGNVALSAMNRGDIPFIMGYNMFLAILSVIGVLLADLMYAVVDPRVKLK